MSALGRARRFGLLAVIAVVAVTAHLFLGSGAGAHATVHSLTERAAASNGAVPSAGHHTGGDLHLAGSLAGAGHVPTSDEGHGHLVAWLCSAVLAAALVVSIGVVRRLHAVHRRCAPSVHRRRPAWRRVGLSFDLAFIDMMTDHHRGAIDDAETLLEDGDHPQVRALADAIIAAQQAEIEQMAAWRLAWAPEGT